MPQVSIILPVLNEAEIISGVIWSIQAVLGPEKIDYELILVENGSEDRTPQVIEELERKDSRIRTLILPKRGWGLAVLAGQKVSRGACMIHMPSDGQIDPAILPVLLTQLQKGSADIVKIRRKARQGWLRWINSRCFNGIANLLFRLKVSDVNGCPKVYRAELIERISLKCKDNLIDLEMLVKARRLGLSIEEISMNELPRAGGRSNINPWTIIEFVRGMLRLWIGGLKTSISQRL